MKKYKYKKYHNKQKNIMKGGDIFDLNSDNGFDLDSGSESKVQQNLEKLEKQFGKNFKIKFDDIVIDAILEKIESPFNNISSYILYNDAEKRYEHNRPFMICFIDPVKKILNNNSYIWNINKTKNITGTQMVKLVLEINKKLGVEKTYLHDGATIDCNNFLKYELSFMKLLEKNYTFYTKFGFKFDVEKSNMNAMMSCNTTEDLERIVEKLVDEIREIKISDIIIEYETIIDIISNVVKDNNFSNLDILSRRYNVYPIFNNIYYNENPQNKIKNLFNESYDMLNLLRNTKEKYLYKYMIELFNDKNNCLQYELLFRYLVENNRYKIKYNMQEVVREYTMKLQLLSTIIHNHMFVYIFS